MIPACNCKKKKREESERIFFCESRIENRLAYVIVPNHFTLILWHDTKPTSLVKIECCNSSSIEMFDVSHGSTRSVQLSKAESVCQKKIDT